MSTTYMARSLDPNTNRVDVQKVQAETEEEVRSGLALRGLLPLSVTAKPRGLSLPGMTKRVKADDLAVFARMFATMYAAAIPVVMALTMLTKATENPTLKAALEEVTSAVQTGKPLSSALAEHEAIFPPLVIALIKAGEIGGFLDAALLQVAESTEADLKLRSEIKAASTYPIVVMCMGLLGGAGMLIWIVPVFASMFTDLGGTLPLPTRIVMKMSDIMKVTALPSVPVIMAASWWWNKNRHTLAVRAILDPIKLKLPVFGKLIKKIAIARFARNLSLLLTSGVQILDALTVVGDTAGNTVVSNTVKNAAVHVREGQQLSEHLGDDGVFPDMIVQMISVGEGSGATPSMLAKVADFYDQQVESTTKKLSSLLEPLLIAGMGVMIGSLIIAMYLPTFQIFDLIRKS